jgi:threonine synthase
VPTGNFGNVLAGHVARLMGLPVAELIIGTNRNDILHRFIATGAMRLMPVEHSHSPSMDIQVSSNFERLLFEVTGRDGAALADAMARFRATGALPVGVDAWQATRALFRSHRVDDRMTTRAIADHFARTGELLDPHSAIAVAAMRATPHGGFPRVALACAHPAKFPDIVTIATGRRPVLPPHLADLSSRPERITVVPNEIGAIQDYIATHGVSV